MKSLLAIFLLCCVAAALALPTVEKDQGLDAEEKELLLALRDTINDAKKDMAVNADKDTEQLKREWADFKEQQQKMETEARGFADTFRCVNKNAECGLFKGKRCCDGLKCSSFHSGNCVEDCLVNGDGCMFNKDGCCSGTCKKINWRKYRCQ